MITRDQARELARKALSVCCVYSEHITPQGRTAIEDAIVQAYELGARRERLPIETEFVLVPREPTKWMLTQGHEGFEDGKTSEVWRRMVNAAPLPPPEVSNET